MRRVIFGTTPTFAKHVPLVSHFDLASGTTHVCWLLFFVPSGMRWSIKEYQCFEIVENHIIFATSRNSSSIHETWTLQLNNTATPWHTQKESPFYLIIRLLFSTWVHCVGQAVVNEVNRKSLLQYGYYDVHRFLTSDCWTDSGNKCRKCMQEANEKRMMTVLYTSSITNRRNNITQ